MFQKTIAKTVRCEGIGVHTGKSISLTLHPAPDNFGIWFKRTDLSANTSSIPALWNHVTDTNFCSILSSEEGHTVSTVEHLMAALAALKIDNLLVEVNGPELPIMDGSSAPFVTLIEKAGTISSLTPRKFLKILKKITVYQGDSWASLEPAHGFPLTYDFQLRHRKDALDTFKTPDVHASFKKALSSARTFGFMEDAEPLRAKGLAQGASLENTVVFEDGKVLNEDGLRFPDECARHKALDAIGDLYLAGAPLMGHFHGHLSGHKVNNTLLRALFADPTAWTLATEKDLQETPVTQKRRSAV
jgi:UDP-3-O-[3-hydroxymyristoyl] N-acetylglucosamine deacetylase